MAKLDSEYPTLEQMREVFEAYKTGKPGAIAEVLRKRQQERKEAEAENVKKSLEALKATSYLRRRG